MGGSDIFRGYGNTGVLLSLGGALDLSLGSWCTVEDSNVLQRIAHVVWVFMGIGFGSHGET